MTDIARIFRNDWSTLDVPELGSWHPTLRVSVVIPAYQCQASLDLLLASLTQQTYPAELLDVVVVDDGSEPRLRLPAVRPERTHLLWAQDYSDGWGIANACNIGAQVSTGEIIMRLDADLVVFSGHVEAQSRWHHQIPYAVTLGAKRFADVSPDRPDWPRVDSLVEARAADRLFDRAGTESHAYVEKLAARTDQLRSADHLAFLSYVGATTGMRREMFEAAGGYARGIRRGSDTEFGYRLAQAGAAFIPEPLAASWHLGPSSMMRDREALQRYSRPFLAEVMPHPRWLRKAGGSGWAVPLVTVGLAIGEQPMEAVRTAVDAVLRSDERDIQVFLIGPWKALTHECRRVLDDPLLDVRLIAATYRSDPRVRLVEEAPDSAFPSPYLIWIGATAALSKGSIRFLIAEADREGVGIVRVVASDSETVVTLTRTAAIGRAAWCRLPGEPVEMVLADTHGALTVTVASAGVADPATAGPAGIEDGRRKAVIANITPSRPLTVEVGGLRTWIRATGLVSRLVARRLGRLGGRAIRRGRSRNR